MKGIIGLGVTAAFCIGCEGTKIYEVKAADNGGVPFYVQEQYDARTYVFEEMFYEVKAVGTFQKLDPKEPDQSAKKQQQANAAASAAEAPDRTFTRMVVLHTRDLRKATDWYTGFIDETDASKAWNVSGKILRDALKAHDATVSLLPFPAMTRPSELTAPNGQARLVGSDRARVQIPSTKPRYLQVTAPFGGTASGTVTLNQDGTLGTATASKTDTFPNTVVAGLASLGASAAGGAPLNSVVSHFLAPAVAQEGGSRIETLKVDFSITPVRRVYALKVTKHVSLSVNDCASASWDGALDALDPEAKCRVELASTLEPQAKKVDDDKAKAPTKDGKADVGGGSK